MGRGKIIFAGITAGALSLSCLAAWAQDMVLSGEMTSMADEQKALKDARAQANDARSRSDVLEAQAATATQDADKARAKVAALAARIQQTEANIREGQARIEILKRLQKQQAAHLAEKQAPAVRLIAAIQNVARRPSVYTLVQPGSVRQAVHVRAVLGTVMPVIEKRTAGLRADLAKSRELRFAAETAAKDMRASQVRLADQQGQLRRMETERRIAARGFTSSASLEADRATALGEKARDIVDLMSKLESAGDLRDELAALPGPSLRPAAPGKTATPARDQATTSPASPAYRLPVVGSVVTGMGELSDSGIRSRGLTIAAQASAQIIAPAGGHVAFAGPYRGFGKIVIIDHGHGWTTLITDMAELSVDAGGTVAQGDPLGVASKGRPKITVELRRNSRPIDIVALVNAG